MKIKASELAGAALNWAVAKAVGVDVGLYRSPFEKGPVVRHRTDGPSYRPSTDWAQIGPLIEQYRIFLNLSKGVRCDAYVPGGILQSGSTVLMAACRAIVAAKLGDTVDIPDELVKEG